MLKKRQACGQHMDGGTAHLQAHTLQLFLTIVGIANGGHTQGSLGMRQQPCRKRPPLGPHTKAYIIVVHVWCAAADT